MLIGAERQRFMDEKYEIEIRNRFYYSDQDGTLRYKVSLQKCEKDAVAGVKDQRGYLRVSVLNKKFLVHRVIFFLCHGYWPKEVDHKDQNKENNRVENLRPCNRSQNKFNTSFNKTKGVRWYDRTQKWSAQIVFQGKQKHLGYFANKSDAILAYNKAAKEFAGDFACLN